MTPEQLREFDHLLTEYEASVIGLHCWSNCENKEHFMALRNKAREAVIAFVKELGK